jgi:(S)-mandelate dehydrogenase
MASTSQFTSVADVRRAARRRLPGAVFDFIEGGAEDKRTQRRDRAVLSQVRFESRVRWQAGRA